MGPLVFEAAEWDPPVWVHLKDGALSQKKDTSSVSLHHVMLSLGSRPRSSWAGHVTQPHLGPFGKGWGTGVVTSGQQVSARTGLAHRVGVPVGRAVSVCGHLMSQGQIHVSGEGPRFRVFPSKAASWCWRGDREDAGGEMAPDPSADGGPRPSAAAGGPGRCPVSPKRWETFHGRGGARQPCRVSHAVTSGHSPANQLRRHRVKTSGVMYLVT